MAPHPQRPLTRCDRFRAASRWHEATHHIFLDQWAQGTLPESVFTRYILQDYVFVQALVPVAGRLYAHAPSLPARRRHQEFLVSLLTDEDRYYEEMLHDLGVAPDVAASPVPLPLTAAFASNLINASRSDDYGPLLALVVAAEWVYEDWVRRLHASPPTAALYRRWVDQHSTEALTRFVGEARAELDSLPLTPQQDESACARFVTVVDYAARFWEMAWSGSG